MARFSHFMWSKILKIFLTNVNVKGTKFIIHDVTVDEYSGYPEPKRKSDKFKIFKSGKNILQHGKLKIFQAWQNVTMNEMKHFPRDTITGTMPVNVIVDEIRSRFSRVHLGENEWSSIFSSLWQ